LCKKLFFQVNTEEYENFTPLLSNFSPKSSQGIATMMRNYYILSIFFVGLVFSIPAFSRPPLCGIGRVKSQEVDNFEKAFRSAFCSKPESPTCNDRWENSKIFLKKALADSRITDVGTISYMFGTIYAETENKNFSPSTTEVIGDQNRNRDYVKPGFYGRGWIQLTHMEKYKKAKKVLKKDFLSHPELAGEEDNAYEILFRGMSEGWIEVYRTSINGAVDPNNMVPIKLGDFVSSSDINYDLARSVINANCKKNKSRQCVPPNIEYRPGLFIPPAESLDVGYKAATAANKMEHILCQTKITF
jgi:hypothetical protein